MKFGTAFWLFGMIFCLGMYSPDRETTFIEDITFIVYWPAIIAKDLKKNYLGRVEEN